MADLSVEARNVRHWVVTIMSKMAESTDYAKSWGTSFALEKAQEQMKRLRDQVKKEVDLATFTREELKAVGFKGWSEDCGMMLVPLWAHGALRDGTKLYCIDGGNAIVGKDEIDNDVRMGCLAYCIMPENKFICLAKGCENHEKEARDESVVAGTK